jgi:glutamate-1-semialdehyde 2,1-aminomutase
VSNANLAINDPKGVAAACREPIEVTASEIADEQRVLFASRRPRSKAMFEKSLHGFFDQVPLHWMRDWPTPFPMIVSEASGSRIIDLDGNSAIDFCLGDTGSMFGHGPAPILAALAKTGRTGLTTMLPSEEAAIVAPLLAARFGLPRWQIAGSASDANRFAIRVARAVTGRSKVLVFDGCYHGAVDETLVDLVDGRTVARPSLLGQVADLSRTTVSIPFNDSDALEAALSSGDVACVIAEPVMTNCGMILPKSGFHQTLRETTRATGTLLHIDETHTISTGLGGYTAIHGLDPDILVVGKPVGGGVPVAVWGMTEDVAERIGAVRRTKDVHGHSGIGTTLSGSALQLACLSACLRFIMTADTYARMNRSADVIETGLVHAIGSAGLPWHVSRVGARLEVIFSSEPVLNAAEARAAASPTIESALHLALLNDGYLLTPFHNMLLVAPTTTETDALGLVSAYERALNRLVDRKAAI